MKLYCCCVYANNQHSGTVFCQNEYEYKTNLFVLPDKLPRISHVPDDIYWNYSCNCRIFKTFHLLLFWYRLVVFLLSKTKLQKIYGRHHNLTDRYEISISQMTMDLLFFTKTFSFLYHCQDFYWTWLYIWVTWRVSINKKQELFTLRVHLSSLPVFWWGPCYSSF